MAQERGRRRSDAMANRATPSGRTIAQSDPKARKSTIAVAIKPSPSPGLPAGVSSCPTRCRRIRLRGSTSESSHLCSGPLESGTLEVVGLLREVNHGVGDLSAEGTELECAGTTRTRGRGTKWRHDAADVLQFGDLGQHGVDRRLVTGERSLGYGENDLVGVAGL